MKNFTPDYTVWVVDDNQEDQYIMQMVLQTIAPSIRVKPIINGTDVLLAIQDCSDGLPNLLLLDLNLGYLTGFDILEEIRNHPKGQTLPVAVLTTSTNVKDAIKAKALGANAYLEKAASYSDLINQIQSVVDRWGYVAQ